MCTETREEAQFKKQTDTVVLSYNQASVEWMTGDHQRCGCVARSNRKIKTEMAAVDFTIQKPLLKVKLLLGHGNDSLFQPFYKNSRMSPYVFNKTVQSTRRLSANQLPVINLTDYVNNISTITYTAGCMLQMH